jgi:hypothetical protein
MMKMVKLAMMAVLGLWFTASTAHAAPGPFFPTRLPSVKKQIWSVAKAEGWSKGPFVQRAGLTISPKGVRTGQVTATITSAHSGMAGGRGPAAVGHFTLQAEPDGILASGQRNPQGKVFNRVYTLMSAH